MKTSIIGGMKSIFICFLCIFILNNPLPTISAEQQKENIQIQIVKVGWFEEPSAFLLNQEGMKTGYGYDYLQELGRFGGWDYEYISVTAQNCLQMLQDGEIDILGPMVDDSRLADQFNFIDTAIFEDYTVLATHDFLRYSMEDYPSFNGMKIGAVKGDLKILYLQEFAQRNQFDYELTLFDTYDEVLSAIKNHEIDVRLTSYAEINDEDVIVAKFNPYQLKFITRKDNSVLLDAFNQAFYEMERLNPSFKSDLETKYFQNYHGSTMALTKEEAAYLKENSVLSVTLASLRKPIMSKEGDEYIGICIDILKEVEKKLNITFNFIEIDNQLNAVKEVQAHQVNLVSNVYADFGWAENNDLYLSVPYFDMDYAAITKENTHVEPREAKVAAVKGYLFSIYYVIPNYNADQIVWYNSEQECVDAVYNGEADICFTNTYVANTYIQDIHYKGLYSSIINFSHGVSLAISKTEADSRLLLSALDKAINSISKSEVYQMIAKNTMFVENYDLSLKEMIERSPVTFLTMFGIFLAVVASLITGIVVMRNNRIKKMVIYKAKLESQRDSITELYNRASLELMMIEYLEKGSHGAFIMIDLDNFKSINDTKGHDFGDQYLIHFAKALKQEFNHGELLCRMGGDEFSVYLPFHTNKELLIERIQRFQKSCIGSNEEYSTYCSIGICFISMANNTFDQCYKEADLALYEAKNNGKNQIHVYQQDV